MSNVFDIIGQSWDFYRKQPVFNVILFWLFVVPQTLMMFIADIETDDLGLKVLVNMSSIILTLILLWGMACVLLISKRLIASKAGRNRTSFKVVRTQASKYILPLFLTDILRSIFTLLWALLFVIPGIIYYVRTAFFLVTIVCEDRGYRDALRQSKEVVMGHTWTVFWYFLGLSAVLFLPILIASGVITEMIRAFDPRLLPAVYLATSTGMSLIILLFTIATVLLYGEVKSLPRKISP